MEKNFSVKIIKQCLGLVVGMSLSSSENHILQEENECDVKENWWLDNCLHKAYTLGES